MSPTSYQAAPPRERMIADATHYVKLYAENRQESLVSPSKIGDIRKSMLPMKSLIV
jgi:hypothetical protein